MQEYKEWLKYGGSFIGEHVKHAQHRDLFDLITEVKDPDDPKVGSNWYDPFESSPDLWKAAMKRLSDDFAAMLPARELSSDRAVRLTFVRGSFNLSDAGATLRMKVKNEGPNLANDVKVFLAKDGEETSQVKHLPVLGVGTESARWNFEVLRRPSGVKYELVCHYGNLLGDRFEVRTPIALPPGTKSCTLGPEQFRVISVE